MEKSKTRVQKVVEFVSGELFTKSTVVSCVAAAPRWISHRVLHYKKKPPGGRFVGVAKALRRILTSYRDIIDEKDSLSNHMINAQEDPGNCRLHVLAAIYRCLLYMDIRYKPYRPLFWKRMQGVESVQNLLRCITDDCSCCSETGLGYKLYRFLRSFDESKKEKAEASATVTVGVMKDCATADGGLGSLECEEEFSYCSSLGLRCHYRLRHFRILASF